MPTFWALSFETLVTTSQYIRRHIPGDCNHCHDNKTIGRTWSSSKHPEPLTIHDCLLISFDTKTSEGETASLNSQRMIQPTTVSNRFQKQDFILRPQLTTLYQQQEITSLHAINTSLARHLRLGHTNAALVAGTPVVSGNHLTVYVSAKHEIRLGGMYGALRCSNYANSAGDFDKCSLTWNETSAGCTIKGSKRKSPVKGYTGAANVAGVCYRSSPRANDGRRVTKGAIHYKPREIRNVGNPVRRMEPE